MKGAVEKNLKRKFEMFQAVEFKSQIVAGTNYFIKVKMRRTCFIISLLLMLQKVI